MSAHNAIMYKFSLKSRVGGHQGIVGAGMFPHDSLIVIILVCECGKMPFLRPMTTLGLATVKPCATEHREEQKMFNQMLLKTGVF